MQLLGLAELAAIRSAEREGEAASLWITVKTCTWTSHVKDMYLGFKPQKRSHVN